MISYGAAQVGDHNGAAAWCAPADASGEFLTLSFGAPVTVTSVGLEPGYDKIDAATGRDRWDENRHVNTVLTFRSPLDRSIWSSTRLSASLTRASRRRKFSAEVDLGCGLWSSRVRFVSRFRLR